MYVQRQHRHREANDQERDENHAHNRQQWRRSRDDDRVVRFVGCPCGQDSNGGVPDKTGRSEWRCEGNSTKVGANIDDLPAFYDSPAILAVARGRRLARRAKPQVSRSALYEPRTALTARVSASCRGIWPLVSSRMTLRTCGRCTGSLSTAANDEHTGHDSACSFVRPG